jgi:predicted  nucleic acid-binding Zn-ribbon protein
MAQSKFNELDAELVKAKETLALEAKVKEAAMATISGLQSKYEALLAKVSGIESNTKTVEEKVAKTVANLGVEPIAAEIQSEAAVKEKTAAEIVAEFESINDAKEKRAFYKKHAQTIIDATFPKKR